MKLNPGKKPNSVVLETSVVEQKSDNFSLGGGYSKADGLVGIVEIKFNNFRGTGDKVNIQTEFGGNSTGRNYQFGYVRPWLDDKQTSMGFNVYNMTNQYNDYDGQTTKSTYDKKRHGWDVTLGRPQGEYIQNCITFKHRQDIYVKNISGEDYGDGTTQHREYLKDNFGLTRSVNLMRVVDSRDNVFNPTEGRRFSLSAEFAGRAFGGDFNFNKYTLESRHYLKVGQKQVLACRVQAGYANGNMPDSGKFSIGDADTLRGYNDDEFKGNRMLAATVEYRFPIVTKVQGVLFSDAGKAWDSGGFTLNDLKVGAGVGIRISTPLGPIRLDYAKSNERTKTHFSFGGQF
jgi:outer membrane protein insertion porin family